MKRKPLYLVVLLIGIMVIIVGAYAQSKDRIKRPVANDSSGLYFKDKYGVYIFIPRDCGFLGCIGPDLRLVKYKKVPHADSETFRILIPFGGATPSTGDILARDRNNVFYGGEYVPTGDVSTLQVLGAYAKDKNNLYFQGLVIRGLDTSTVQVPGRDFIADRNGLYLANSSLPRKAALVDYPTFKVLPRAMTLNGKYYVAEDKNFYYYSDGGSYRVEGKPNTNHFKKLGCGYYYFGGQIFYSVYQLSGADAATFRVLDAHENREQDVESCQDFYAIDKDHRYQFELRVRPEDTYRNHQIDLLLATPEDKMKMSGASIYICVPENRPGVNFGLSQVPNDSTNPGTVKILHFFDAYILKSQLINADGQWQPLPTITQRGLLGGCNSVRVEQFWENEKRHWLGRRDPTSISLVVNQFGENPVYVIADSGYSIKLVFSKTSLTELLRDNLSDSRVAPFDDSAAGWGSGWILENKFFMSREHMPELWVPLRVKGVAVRYKEGQDYITVGFKYSDGQFECLDTTQCSSWSIPHKFKAALN